MVYTIKFLIDSISIHAKGVLRPNSDSLDYKIYTGIHRNLSFINFHVSQT